MALPPDIIALIETHPLETPAKTAKALASDLQGAAQRYARHAGRTGRDFGLWQVWLAIQRERGLDLDHALGELSAQDRRWLGVAALESQRDEVGLAAYARYLREPGDIGPFAHETERFLDALKRADRGPEAMQWVAELEARNDSTPVETLWAARESLARNDLELARARVDVVLRRNRDWADAWAVSALVAMAQGRPATDDAKKAAKRELRNEGLLAELRDRLGSDVWDRLVSTCVMPLPGYEEQMAAFEKDPGMSLEPSDSPTPHCYGGADFVMPPCAGCGHPIRQRFLLDLSAIPELHRKLPAWRSCPFLGCTDCMVWMGRHDYVVAAVDRRITLSNVAISLKEFGKNPDDPAPPLERRYARLTPVALTADPFDLDLGPLVGGAPLWTQDARHAFCPQCDEPMVYVGAMSTPTQFEPPFVINNESGFQYHFACNACSTLSVIAQWT